MVDSDVDEARPAEEEPPAGWRWGAPDMAAVPSAKTSAALADDVMSRSGTLL